jgi:hypothetical protein
LFESWFVPKTVGVPIMVMPDIPISMLFGRGTYFASIFADALFRRPAGMILPENGSRISCGLERLIGFRGS